MKTQKVRPLLVETKELTNIFKDHSELFYSNLESQTGNSFNSSVVGYKLILISLDSNDKIEVGDKYVIEISYATGELRGYVLEECTSINDVWINKYDVTTTRHIDNCKKVIATQDQLSPEYIQQFIEEYRNGDIENVEIEIIDIPNSSWGFSEDEPMYLGYKPKLTNGFITIVSKPKLYTEEEVKEFCYKAMKYKGYTEYNECMDWFEQNKKK